MTRRSHAANLRRRAVDVIRRGGSVEVPDASAALALLEELHRVGLFALHVFILHDDECNAARCLCEPGFAIEQLTPETALAGVEAHEHWLRRTARASA